jgi:[ribosomal protein S18]-alanine N-acetyltransferase
MDGRPKRRLGGSATMAERWLIRAATLEDLEPIVAAERICFSDPWSSSGIRELLQSETGLNFVCFWPGAEARLAGYLFARTIAGEGEILNLAVLPEARGKGLGRRLLRTGLDALATHRAEAVFLEVRESNEEAKGLYRSAGFSVVGVRAGYYRNPREDALVLRRDRVAAEK